ncbi:MAG: S8 family serine peptidase [Muribaculaceae bacterium]|nr:S8 family serine peptidase [Muribaculaceae bacterium]
MNGVEAMDCFIALNSKSTDQLKALGVIITGEFDGIVTALVPINKVDQVAKLDIVQEIAIAPLAHHMTDQAKNVTKAYQAWNGTSNGLPNNYRGTGVVVGVIDTGMDFNHRAFFDASGNNRIKAVYLPNATTANGGTAPTVGSSTLPGYHYTTASQIAALTTDYNAESHGTHTSGCAGGSEVGNYAGMAPDCDLVLCGLGDNLSQTSIANSAKYIANYAKTQGKPCVISISLGSNTGPHDGSSYICRLYDQVAVQYGAVILLSSGNEADATGYASRTLSSANDAFVIMHETNSNGANVGGSAYYGTPIMDIWGRTNDQLKLKVLIVNKSSGAIVYTSDEITSSTTLNNFGSYFNSSSSVEINFSSSNNRKNIYIYPSMSGAKNSNYRLTYMVTSEAGNTIDAWCDGGHASVIASSGNISGYTLTKGQADGTMSDDICGSKTISVGAQASRASYYENYPYNQGDVAYFSSFGTDIKGVNHPFITAPGHYVISSLNGYDSTNSQYGTSYSVSYNGRTHKWGKMSGTSMSTPIAAGVVALYLQADPELDVNGVKDAIANTATAYSNPQSPPKQRGYGIINALDGISYVLQQSALPRIIASKTEVNMNGYVGDTITTTINLEGRNLTQGVNVSVVGPNIYSVEPTSFTNAEIMAGTTLTIKFIPTSTGNTSATINLNSAGAQQVSINVNGVANPKTPTLSTSYESLDFTAFAGGTATKSFRLYGEFINDDVTLTSDNQIFTVSPNTISAATYDESSYVTVTVTYAPTAAGTHNGTITISSPGAQSVTVALTGTSTINNVAPHATDATGVAATSFTANWDPCPFATSYTLRIKPAVIATPLFTETFAKCTKESTTNIASTINNYTDNAGWAASYVYQAVGGIRLGATSYNGVLQSPAVDLSSSTGKVSVKFTARAYDTDVDCPLAVSCGESADTIIVPSSNEGSFIAVLDCAQEAGQKIRFATLTKKKRVVITSVEIYDVDLNDTSSQGDPILINGITNNHYSVNGLSPETTYIYDVMALYNTAASNWSNMIEVTTLAGGAAIAGDVDGDGFVTSSDITALYSFLLSNDSSNLVNGDQDGDGNITASDVTTVYSILLGVN